MNPIVVKLFTRGTLADPEDGRALIDLLGEYLPQWLPHRYGWSAPLKNVYDPARFGHFWNQLEYNLDWRNETRTATGQVSVRVGPYDTLSSIDLRGDQKRAPDPGALAAFTQGAGQPLDLAYGILHRFDPGEMVGQGGHLFRAINGNPVPAVDERSLKESLPDLAWGNVFGPPYVELFGGADRVRSAPAAEVRELGPDRFWVQLTPELADVQDDRAALAAAREAVKEHLGADCFAGYPGTLRAPRLPLAVEEGLWSPPDGFAVPDELQKLLDQAVRDGKTPPPAPGTIEKNTQR